MKAKNPTRKRTKKQDKPLKKHPKMFFKKKAVVVADVQMTENDEDLRSIMNKSDFDKYELDAFLNELN